MLHMVTPSLSVVSSQASTSKSAESASSVKSGPAFLEIDEDVAMRAKNLSAILQKLFLWEQKLYNEVKVFQNHISFLLYPEYCFLLPHVLAELH